MNEGSGSQRTVDVPSGGAIRTTLTVGTTQVCQVPGQVTFDSARSFIRPTLTNESVLQNVVVFAGLGNRHRDLLVVGHTDSVGSRSANEELSQRRARSTLAVLQGNTGEWEALFNTEGWGTPELTVMVVETGDADPSDPTSVRDAVRRHSGSANRTARASLFRRYFEKLLDQTGVPSISFVPLTPPILGCGEGHLLRGTRSSPSRDPTQPEITGDFEPNRRSEFFFFERVSIPMSCIEYPNWSLACSLTTPPPAKVDWFVSGVGQDAPGRGRTRTEPARTIQFVIDEATSLGTVGTDVIHVMDGLYTEDIRLQSDIVIEADQGAVPRVARKTVGQPIMLLEQIQGVQIRGLGFLGRNQENRAILVRRSRDVEISGCNLETNRSDGLGGALLITDSASVRVSGCTLGGNFAVRGGGLAAVDSTGVTIEDCTIEDNQAGTIATAVTRVEIDVAVLSQELDVFNIDVGNSHGGGVYFEGTGDVLIKGCRIRENRAILFGGGIAVDNAPGFNRGISIVDNEITCNQVAHGGLDALGAPANDCTANDLGDPLLERMEEETIDKAAGKAVRLLHGVGVESGLGGGVALRNVTAATRLVNNRIGTTRGPNRARRGGGIECYTGAYPRIEGNSVQGNLTSDDGAGIAIDQFDPFLPNSQPRFLGFRQGTFVPRQPILMVDNQIRSNRSVEDGGGVYATGGAEVEITGGAVNGNRAAENGGGIRASYAARLIVTGVTITSNEANVIGNESEAGGGIAARNAQVELHDCDISDNTSNRFAGGGAFVNSAFEGGFDRGGFIQNRAGQFDEIMEAFHDFRTRRYMFDNCRGDGNRATGTSGAGGYVYAVRIQGDEAIEIVIQGSATAIGANTSEYANPSNPGGLLQKRGNVVLELSGRRNTTGFPQDRVNIFGNVPAVPAGIAVSTPLPAQAVAVIHGDGSPDDHPTNFPYTNLALSVADIQPRFGPDSGGTAVDIAGSGFLAGSATVVSFADVPAINVQVHSSTRITAETPPLPAPLPPGLVDVEVRSPDGQSDVVQGIYEYLVAPTIIDVQPRSGSTLGGTPITLTGSDFRPGVEVLVARVPCTNVQLVSSSEITADTPPLSPGQPPGFADVVVQNPDGQTDTVAGGFRYVAPPPPSIIDVQPRSGPITGGTDITITGTGFLVGVDVIIGSTPAVNVVRISDQEILATTPPAAFPGRVDVAVQNPDLQADIVSDGFEYLP